VRTTPTEKLFQSQNKIYQQRTNISIKDQHTIPKQDAKKLTMKLFKK
jgi:hypothetical protein